MAGMGCGVRIRQKSKLPFATTQGGTAGKRRIAARLSASGQWPLWPSSSRRPSGSSPSTAVLQAAAIRRSRMTAVGRLQPSAKSPDNEMIALGYVS